MQSRQYTANVPLPSKLNVSDGCLSHNWEKFKRQFQNYRVASRLDKEPNEFQSAVILATVGKDAMDIFAGFKFEQEADMQDLGKIMEKFEDFCVGETHEAYESYKFHLRRQELSETIEAYIFSLRQLAKNCNFGVLEDRMIRDQVVMGVREDAVREKLVEDKKLDQAKCLELGRAYKTSRQQSQSITQCPSPIP